jgi:hypothetical protein
MLERGGRRRRRKNVIEPNVVMNNPLACFHIFAI